MVNKLGIEENFLNIMKTMYEKSTATSYSMVKDWNLFPQDKKEDKNAHFCPLFLT